LYKAFVKHAKSILLFGNRLMPMLILTPCPLG